MGNVFRPRINGRKSRWYYGKVRDPNTGKWRKVALKVSDEQVAKKKLADEQRRVERIAKGLIDPAEEESLKDAVSDFKRHLRQRRRGELYIGQTEAAILKAALFCAGKPLRLPLDWKGIDAKWESLGAFPVASLTPAAADRFLASLPDTLAARTKNGYRTALVAFFNFLVSKRRVAFNPMLSVTRHEGEVKRKRRALSAPDLQRLLDAARLRPLASAERITRGKRKGKRGARLRPETRARLERIGRERPLIYATAFYTGLRRGELHALRVGHLHLDATPPHVHLPGELTKNGKDAKLPLPAAFADKLRGWVQGRGADEKVFRVPKTTQAMVAVLKRDLAFAGIPYVDDQGRYFDFHSLRKCLGTQLRLAKVDPAVSQQFMRHADIRLTMEIYNDDQLHDLNAEVTAKLPSLSL